MSNMILNEINKKKNNLLFLRLGAWGVRLYPITQYAIDAVALYKKTFAPFFSSAPRNEESYPYLILADDQLSLEEVELPDWLMDGQELFWVEFTKDWKKAFNHYKRIRSQLSNQDISYSRWFSFSWSKDRVGLPRISTPFQHSLQPDFICLVTEKVDNEMNLALWIYSLSLAAEWHIDHGGLCLHSSSIATSQGGVVFLGDSGFGKSTVAELSASVGYEILGDDVNFINFKQNYTIAAGPSAKLLPKGYSRCQPLLRGVFLLKQDIQDYLVPLYPIQIARLLFKSLIQTPPGGRLSNTSLIRAFHTIGDIVRHIPGYELHFRKSPDFLRLINDHFPD